MVKELFNDFSQEQLLLSIQSNDERVLQWLYQENYQKIERFILANSGSEDQAKDIYQEAFLSVYTRIKTGKFIPQNTTAIQGFLYQVAKNKWLNQLRDNKEVPLGFHAEIPDNTEEEDGLDQELTQIEMALKTMGKKCQDLLTRFYYQKSSLEELSRLYGWSKATTKNNKYRCMEKLRNLLEIAKT